MFFILNIRNVVQSSNNRTIFNFVWVISLYILIPKYWIVNDLTLGKNSFLWLYKAAQSSKNFRVCTIDGDISGECLRSPNTIKGLILTIFLISPLYNMLWRPQTSVNQIVQPHDKINTIKCMPNEDYHIRLAILLEFCSMDQSNQIST